MKIKHLVIVFSIAALLMVLGLVLIMMNHPAAFFIVIISGVLMLLGALLALHLVMNMEESDIA
jgi:hypothetical protein